MPHSYLRLRFQDDHDGTGKLLARAEAAGFAGESGAYFNISEIEEFAAAIAVFPVPENESYSISGGFGKPDGSGEVEQEHLGIEVYPLDSRRGTSACRFGWQRSCGARQSPNPRGRPG